MQADGFLLTPVSDIGGNVVRIIADLPTPTLFGPIDLSLVDILPLKEFRAVPGQIPELSTWTMMALGFAGLRGRASA